MEIRLMRPREVERVIEVWMSARGRPVDSGRVARVREKLTDPAAATVVAVEEVIMGMVLTEPGRADDGAGEIMASDLHVSMVFVSPGAQRRGVGSALMRHVLAEAASRGVVRVALWTGADNLRARALYESVGMVPTRTRQVTPTVEWVRYETGGTQLA